MRSSVCSDCIRKLGSHPRGVGDPVLHLVPVHRPADLRVARAHPGLAAGGLRRPRREGVADFPPRGVPVGAPRAWRPARCSRSRCRSVTTSTDVHRQQDVHRQRDRAARSREQPPARGGVLHGAGRDHGGVFDRGPPARRVRGALDVLLAGRAPRPEVCVAVGRGRLGFLHVPIVIVAIDAFTAPRGRPARPREPHAWFGASRPAMIL